MSLSKKRTASGGRPVRLMAVASMVGSVVVLTMLPIDASHAGMLDWFRSSKTNDAKSAPKQAAPSTRALSPEHAASAKARVAEEDKPAKPVAQPCDPAKFRIIVDVGHTKQSDGAMSARNIPEYEFNLRLARKVVEGMKAEGFAAAKLLVTEGGARPSLGARVNSANHLRADLFLSIHHDSVPDNFKEKWEFEGKKLDYSDRFSGYGLFVSKSNVDFEDSLRFAKLIGTQLRAQGIKFADQYTLPIMGKYRHDLLDRDAGVYRYDHLIVLMKTNMPAALLEAGSIINRDEELQMASAERQDMTVKAVTTALKQYCGLPDGPALLASTPPAAPALAGASADAQPKAGR